MTDPIALEAAVDGKLVVLLGRLRTLASSDLYAGLPQHIAAVKLAEDLDATLDQPGLLAHALANLLISEARTPELPPLVTTDEINQASKSFDPLHAGVEVRLIGPEPACRRVLAEINNQAVPLTDFRGPRAAVQPGQEGNVRFYAYTDNQTKSATRGQARRASRARKNGTDS